MYKRLPIFLCCIFITACSLFSVAFAQELPGKRDSITSAILNEKRVIQVVLPEKYKPGSADKYDVLYVLDGDGNTKTISQVQQFIESEGYMPPTIIIGILNTDCNRDFLPTHVADTRTSGGADKFLGFLKNELIPYVDKTYLSNGDNTLFGHSYGGVFVTYALLNEPQLFKSYIAADPSYWYDNGVMRKQVKEKIAGLANLDKTLYITGREGQGLIGMGIPPMDTVLRNNAPAGLTWKITAYPDETHGSVRLKSMYDGLKYSYRGYLSHDMVFHPMNGIMLKDKPIKIARFDNTYRVRYTTDGSDPVLSSKQMFPEITLSAPGKLTAKAFGTRSRYNRVTTGDFKEGAFLPSLSKVKNMKPGGFHYKYYEGEWDKLPDFKTLKPVKEGIVDSAFSMQKLPHQNNFALLIEGQMEATEEGYYLFILNSDDGSRLSLANQQLIDYDGLHGANGERSFIVPLQKGFYPVKLEYFQKGGDKVLNLMYITPSAMDKKQPVQIPFALQYSRK